MVITMSTSIEEQRLNFENVLRGKNLDLIGDVSDQASTSSSGLDSDAKDVLDFIHSLPPVYTLDLDTARRFRPNPFEHPTATDITKLDILIPCKNRTLAARLYRPAGSEQTILPTLVYFHGGGFVLGSIESYDKMLGQLCSLSKISVISVEYRLAPDTRFPGAVEDAQESMDWIASNAKFLNIDQLKIAIGGDSAGANLAAVYCQLNKHRTDFTAYFQLLIYPSIIGNDSSKSRQLFSDNLLLTKDLLRWFHRQYIDDDQASDPRFNVLNFDDFSDVPPAFVLTAGYDPLRDEGQEFAKTLIQSGVLVKHTCYLDMFHGFINFGALKQAKDAVIECAQTLNLIMNFK